MSFTLQPIPPSYSSRCYLFVPANKPTLFEKAIKSEADVITIDLEDSVPPDQKVDSRQNVIDGLQRYDWREKRVVLRINALDTPFFYRDLIEILESDVERLDSIMIPKVGTAADVYAVDLLVTQIKVSKNLQKNIALEIILESALGLQNIVEITKSSKRLEAVHFGSADYAASMGMLTTSIGGTQESYGMLSEKEDPARSFSLNDPWHYPLVQMVMACRAQGLLPIDGPFGDFSDEAGYLSQAKRSQLLGCSGKWAIHPRQVPLAQNVFTPSEETVAQAMRILKAMEEAQEQGLGAVTLEGRLIDFASIRQAKFVVKQFQQFRPTEQSLSKFPIFLQNKTFD